MRSFITTFVFSSFLLLFIVFIPAPDVEAQTVEQLQAQIVERNKRLGEIEKEIAQFESALKEVGAERSTLEKAISGLELERRKINADIEYTQNLISNTDLQISKLSIEINQTLRDITLNRSAIGEILRSIQISDDDSFVEILLNNKNVSEFWGAIEDLESVRGSMEGQVKVLTDLQAALENKKFEETGKRSELVDLKSQYADQQTILSNNKKEKDTLLSATKNEESGYQSLLKQKQAARDLLRKEVQNIEAELKFILDPNTIPTKGSAVFRWPLDNNIITQRFGYTKFALSGAYGGSQHNGMDLGTPTGSKLYAPLTGVVRAVGNTDIVPGCYSWGKWILLDHPNGLSTMFAHLSHIGVTPGQRVATSDIIGYTGNTGYSTGPHLHFTLYVSDAVQVKPFNQFKAATSCGAASSPFSAIEGYLDPLDYLPPL